MQYKILFERDSLNNATNGTAKQRLEEQVFLHTKSGWQLYGNLSIITEMFNGVPYFGFVQTMVLLDENPTVENNIDFPVLEEDTPINAQDTTTDNTTPPTPNELFDLQAIIKKAEEYAQGLNKQIQETIQKTHEAIKAIKDIQVSTCANNEQKNSNGFEESASEESAENNNK